MEKSKHIVILKETEHWLAVNKPAGMTVHNRAGEDLLSLLSSRYPDCELHLAHRLDAGTSGVLLLAKGTHAASGLKPLFEQRQVSKSYLCMGIKNSMLAINPGDEGVWKWSLTKKAESRKNPRGWSGQRVPCSTHWRCVQAEGTMVTLLCRPETGRKHQIRRHAAVAGIPLLGDFRYGQSCAESETLHLHAFTLEFLDPFSGNSIELMAEAPPWCADASALLLSKS